MTITKHFILAGVLSAAALFAGAQVSAQENAQQAEPAVDQRKAKIQAGAWFLAPWNSEAAPANFFRANKGQWFDGPPNNKKPLDRQYIDPATGLPQSLPHGSIVYSPYMWNVAGFDGTWVLEAIGDVRISAGLARNQRRISKNRVEFVNDPSFRPVLLIEIHQIGKGGLRDIRLYRKEDEARLDAGKYWSSAFVGEASKYDIIRTMDLQSTNGMFLNEASDVAPVNYAFWASGAGRKGAKGSLPLEALFALGVEADTEIWFQTPIHLGFPYDWDDPRIAESGGSDNVEALRFTVKSGVVAETGKSVFQTVIDSNEWDKYADNVVAALEASNYPETRMLYIGLGNEIWNWGGWGFRVQTHYADGVGEAYVKKNGDHNRAGYGVLSARLMLAFDAAFARAGRDQARIHVIEGQAANDYTTVKALQFARDYIQKEGLKWSDYAPRMGVSVASYWGGPWQKQMSFDAWKAAIAQDPAAAAKARADFLIDGPANSQGTKSWVVQQFARHKAQAAAFGVKLIGAYEGGSHDTKPPQIPDSFYNAYMWGPEGARVNQAVNDALVAAFPGIILSNYVLAGPVGGQPWHDGMMGEDTPMQRSWVKYQRK